ncbi:HTH-type transcriptional regulator BetI [Mesorhizobium sp. L-8-10]|uniref:TetR family transcriptional regulator C-terminal domain-containing protein n=1 Tax=Mesorhizobium sp. L-8-10 TaxID=2744523 RepID=UPI001928989A|nr:TetR family transcriptional regulator C-terminal domain-containing protein [Mesorhizobium sp. L-8-10]BCH29904.1 HTH-type transcriptional regulator BetI [Mesorhizobium sp. L-8-10]
MDELETVKANRIARRQNRKPSRIAQERKLDLIDAAIRDIAAKGYDKVTVSTICEEAGFSRGLIGHYFSSKDALLLEAVETVARRLGDAIRRAAASAGPNPMDRLYAVIHASFTPPGCTAEHMAVWVALTGTARWSPDLRDLYQRIWRGYRTDVGRLLDRAAKSQKIEIDVKVCALAFSQIVEGLWISCNADPDVVSTEEAEECCRTFVNAIFQIRD